MMSRKNRPAEAGRSGYMHRSDLAEQVTEIAEIDVAETAEIT